MNELEQRIAALRIAAPSDALDDRVLAILRGEAAAGRQGQRTVRLPMVMTVAAACLVAGVLTGYLAGAMARGGVETAANFGPAPSMAALAGNPGRLHAGRGQESDLLTVHLTDGRFSACRGCHGAGAEESDLLQQFRGVARRRAAFWENETGDLFLLASHMTDARFALCRQCHMPEGSDAAM